VKAGTLQRRIPGFGDFGRALAFFLAGHAALAPTFLLQPLIDNASIHGLKRAQQTGVIVVKSAPGHLSDGRPVARTNTASGNADRSNGCRTLRIIHGAARVFHTSSC
jgi:hypothetical protein